jgi:hypothetical protein
MYVGVRGRLQDDEFDPDSVESMRRVRDREWEVSEDRVVALLESKPVTGHPWPTCCFPPFKPSASFLLLTKRCILQFVVLKARLTPLTLSLYLSTIAATRLCVRVHAHNVH